jgi:hypothetical protein
MLMKLWISPGLVLQNQLDAAVLLVAGAGIA